MATTPLVRGDVYLSLSSTGLSLTHVSFTVSDGGWEEVHARYVDVKTSWGDQLTGHLSTFLLHLLDILVADPRAASCKGFFSIKLKL